MSATKKSKKLYTKQDIDEARQKMLDHLASISGGVVILGCCTQGCCENEAQSFSVDLGSTGVTQTGAKDT